MKRVLSDQDVADLVEMVPDDFDMPIVIHLRDPNGRALLLNPTEIVQVKQETIQDVAMIARNGIDKLILLERENALLRECLLSSATTLRCVASHHESGLALPGWLAEDCRVALAYIVAELKLNVL